MSAPCRGNTLAAAGALATIILMTSAMVAPLLAGPEPDELAQLIDAADRPFAEQYARARESGKDTDQFTGDDVAAETLLRCSQTRTREG